MTYNYRQGIGTISPEAPVNIAEKCKVMDYKFIKHGGIELVT